MISTSAKCETWFNVTWCFQHFSCCEKWYQSRPVGVSRALSAAAACGKAASDWMKHKMTKALLLPLVSALQVSRYGWNLNWCFFLPHNKHDDSLYRQSCTGSLILLVREDLGAFGWLCSLSAATLTVWFYSRGVTKVSDSQQYLLRRYSSCLHAEMCEATFSLLHKNHSFICLPVVGAKHTGSPERVLLKQYVVEINIIKSCLCDFARYVVTRGTWEKYQISCWFNWVVFVIFELYVLHFLHFSIG